MAVRIAGIQPGYLPWLGYFDQMRRVDAFILADEMQFSSSGWAHRNRVRGPQGPHWLHLPARPRAGEQIVDVRLDAHVPWRRKHMTTLRHFYKRSPHAAGLLPELGVVLERTAPRMVDASIPLIRWLADKLGIETPLLVSSELGLEARYREQFPDEPGPTHRIVAFLKSLGATHLLEGDSGRSYLDVELCNRHGIAVEFHRYAHPEYRQLHLPFVSHLSAIDLLLCAGEDESRRVLSSAS